jgi:hypothetical protein
LNPYQHLHSLALLTARRPLRIPRHCGNSKDVHSLYSPTCLSRGIAAVGIIFGICVKGPKRNMPYEIFKSMLTCISTLSPTYIFTFAVLVRLLNQHSPSHCCLSASSLSIKVRLFEHRTCLAHHGCRITNHTGQICPPTPPAWNASPRQSIQPPEFLDH